MSLVKLHIVDAFTRISGEGNRAGVVLEADLLSAQQMQEIAAIAGYSETAFVLKPDDDTHDLHVRYFTPSMEVPICGHATIATHFVRNNTLSHLKSNFIAKTGAGNLPIEIEGSGLNTTILMTQAKPEFGTTLTPPQCEILRSALAITSADQIADLPIQIVSTGHSKVMVPITSRKTLNNLTPNMNALASLSKEIDCNGFFIFTIEKESAFETHGRMFAPAIGINEDPVTGNANGPAGAYLTHYNILNFGPEFSYCAHQGFAMGKPGKVDVRLIRSSDQDLTVKIAGQAVISGTMMVKI